MPNTHPGRDLIIFLLMLLAVDVSGVLHVYGLSALYNQEFFFGLGILFVLLAAGLLFRIPGTDPGAPRRWTFEPVVAVALGALLFLLGLIQLLTAVGRAAAWPGFSWEEYLLLFVLALATAVAARVAFTRRERVRRRWLAIIAAVWLGYAVASLLYRVAGGPPSDEWLALLSGPVLWPLLGIGALAAWGVLFPHRPAAFLVGALVIGLGVRLVAFSELHITLNLNMGDMLPLVSAATDRLLEGQSPYFVYSMPYELPLTYWPLTILTYLPFGALGQDLRSANLLFGAAVTGALLLLRSRADLPKLEPGWAAYAFGVLYLTPTMFSWDLVTAAPPFWLWLALLMAVVVWDPPPVPHPPGDDALASPWPRRLELVPGIALGAAFAAGPLALPFAPFLVVWWLKRGPAYALRQLLAAAAAGTLLVIPFVLWDVNSFWYGTVTWFNDLDKLPGIQWERDRSWLYEIGVAGQLWAAGLQSWLKPLQVLILAALTWASWRRLHTPADILRWGSAAYVLFITFNPVIWPYLYVPALLGLVFVLAARGRAAAASRTPPAEHEMRPEHALPGAHSGPVLVDNSPATGSGSL